jgi:uncharacterized delta-60 repeat protein
MGRYETLLLSISGVAMARLTAVGLCGLAAVASLASPAFGAPAELDPSFSGDGKARTNFTRGIDHAYAVAIQSDGKIVAVGRSDHGTFALVRYATDGTLDPTFGRSGKTTTNLTRGFDVATAVVLQTDGKIVVAGQAGRRFDIRFGLARYNADGALDPSFSDDGKLVTNFTPGTDFAWDVTLEADGKIVAAGFAAAGSGGKFALARYNADGSLDDTFSGDGQLTTNLSARPDSATAVAIQSDAKIVVAGAANIGSISSGDSFFALARYNSDGTLDSTFAGDGTAVTNFTPRPDHASDLVLQPDGKIVATGRAAGRFGVARYNGDGTLDSTFGGDGRVTINFTKDWDFAEGIALQADGKIVVVGDAANLKFAVARLNSDGMLDVAFGGDGKVTTDFAPTVDFARDVSLQADGKIVVVGGTGGRFAVARYMGG